MAINGVIFDMGGTLLHYNAPGTTWEDTEKTGARAVYAQLQAWGYTLPPETQALDMAWEYAVAVWTNLQTIDPRELTLDHQIAQVAGIWGIPTPGIAAIETLSRAYMAAIQAHVRPLEGAREVLDALRRRGTRIGLVSNTLWPATAHLDDLSRFDITPFLEHTVFSADALAWKPDSRIFQLSLDALRLQPHEAVYVGDSLYFDVWGAQQAGLRAVWIEQTHRWLPDGLDVEPDATIRRLHELLPVIATWQ